HRSPVLENLRQELVQLRHVHRPRRRHGHVVRHAPTLHFVPSPVGNAPLHLKRFLRPQHHSRHLAAARTYCRHLRHTIIQPRL
ncbi:hypothetical protein GNI_154200, partial [Gregarina niphandrodes]